MTRALLVIDVQNEYFDGAFPIAYPPRSVSLPNITAAMDAATAAGVPVVVVQHVDDEDSPVFARGSHGGALHSELVIRPHDVLVEKSLPSSFVGTGLDDWLRERRVDTVAITGYMTQHCDESTARDAAHRGYTVEVLSDATGAPNLTTPAGSVDAKTLHETVLTVLSSGFAAVVPTAEWIAALAEGGELPGPDLVAAIGDAAR